ASQGSPGAAYVRHPRPSGISGGSPSARTSETETYPLHAPTMPRSDSFGSYGRSRGALVCVGVRRSYSPITRSTIWRVRGHDPAMTDTISLCSVHSISQRLWDVSSDGNNRRPT